ncbi:MAG TPA: ATP-binding cassette domain-containing protein [Dehalococcoidia bacterium]|nr:ATP-binding cassette domain-containing protein [Dehalococcoidia bacterium]
MTAVTGEGVPGLKAVPIFSRCSPEELAAVAASLELVEYARDAVIFREGEPGEEMFVIARGQVRIVSDAATEKVVFAHLAPGDFFGEMALLSGDTRSAAAIATTDASLWRLTRERFQALLAQYPQINEEISRVLAQRVSHGNVHRFQNEAVALLTLTPEREEFTIGRWAENDLQINDPHVDGLHARIRRQDGRWIITDEGSTTGTYVNRQRIKEAELRDGDEVLVGTSRVYLDGLKVKSFSHGRGVRIDAIDLGKTVGSKRILDGINLSIVPGEFVALVGGSGAGKTSLLHALNGFSPGTEGAVQFDGTDLYANLPVFRTAIGYLPQDDIIHTQLTVERTLFYAARLRLPGDMGKAELEKRIEEVLETVGLSEHRRKAVSLLSGGQRKRLSLAVELLATPRAFFLDEPTSGLDPALESRMMALFQSLTEDGATVVLSTHSTQSLGLCDKIAWLSQGRLVFFGSPAECLRHFHCSTFGEVYDLLNGEGATEKWVDSFQQSRVYQANVVERRPALAAPAAGARPQPVSGPRTRGASGLRQLFWLTLRYAEVMARDPKYLGLLLLQAPAIALSLLLLFQADIFALTADEGGDALLATAALKGLVLSAIWLGAFNAARAISSETAIYARERLVNLGVVPYIGSKVIVLAVLCLVQAFALVSIVLLRVDVGQIGWDVYPLLVLLTFMTALAGLTMGLLVSGAVANSDQAMALVPMLLIPQLIFDGSFVPVEKMLAPARMLSNVVLSRWSLELGASITSMADRFAAQLPAPFAEPYVRAFTIDAVVHWSVLAAFIVVPLALTLVMQKRKDRVVAR